MNDPKPDTHMPPATAVPWYLSKAFVWILIVLIGPLAIPFLWLSPRFTPRTKKILSITMVVVTILFFVAIQQVLTKAEEMGIAVDFAL